jgi:hypothetical protein
VSSTYGAVTVTNVATQIMPATNGRYLFVIYNNGSVPIYIGFDANVLNTTGIPILPQANYTQQGFGIWAGAVYGITASSSADTRFWNSSG